MKRNVLNDLDGSRWLYFTNTIWKTDYPPDATHKLRKAHGAMKPPQAMMELVEFFTRKGGSVVDPFAGVGGTLLGAELAGRSGVGIELNKRWIEVFENIKKSYGVFGSEIVKLNGARIRKMRSLIERGNCLELLPEMEAGSFDACICDPPYGPGQGKVSFRKETNFDMDTDDPEDFGNADSVEEFLKLMARTGAEVHRVLKAGRYFVILIGDRYMDGEFVPLGYMTAQKMRTVGFELKGMKIWWNAATQRRLKPYGLGSCFVPNITHQNVVILRRR
jgi:DNA modification methylase